MDIMWESNLKRFDGTIKSFYRPAIKVWFYWNIKTGQIQGEVGKRGG